VSANRNFRRANLVLYHSATVGFNLLAVVMFYHHSFPIQYCTMFVEPNIMLMNIMACRVYRNTKLGNERMDPTTAISESFSRAIAFQGVDSNSTGTILIDNISKTDNQPRGVVETNKADVIEIYSSHKNISTQVAHHTRGDRAA